MPNLTNVAARSGRQEVGGTKEKKNVAQNFVNSYKNGSEAKELCQFYFQP